MIKPVQILSLLISFACGSSAEAQDIHSSLLVSPKIVLTPDTTICKGSSIKLNAENALKYSWSPSASLDSPEIKTPLSTSPATVTYYLDALMTSTNVISNGDFSVGNSGFTSGYNYANPNLTEGQYFVGSSSQAWNSSLSNCGDHTTGTGNMMLVNGSPVPDIGVWKEVVSVLPNTNYAFSTWIEALWPPNPAILSFSINGVDIGNLITATLPTCTWSQFYAVWNSGSNTTATISIVNKNTAILGNDFALDDISFAPYQTIRDSVTITIESPLVKTNNDTSICPGSTIQLFTTGANSYTWSPSDYLTSSSIGNPESSPSSSIQYIVEGLSTRGCIAKDSLHITVLPRPSITISKDTQVCLNSQVRLFAAGGSSYVWSPASGLNNANISDPVATVGKTQTYTVSVTATNSCTNTDSVDLTLRPYPEFSASENKTTCKNTPVVLTATGGGGYVWSPTSSVASPNSASTSVNPEQSSVFFVQIKDSVCSFDTTIAINVIVNPIPTVEAKKSNDIDCNTPVATLFASGAEKYLWSPSEVLSSNSDSIVTATIEKDTKFSVTGTNEFGCSSTSFVFVAVGKTGTPRFVVPNAFTPNGDNLNDCFGVKNWGNLQLKEFSIFNRWGQQVFKTSNPSDCWDGSFKGRKQDSGNYAYIIKAMTICGIVTRTGNLLLIR